MDSSFSETRDRQLCNPDRRAEDRCNSRFERLGDIYGWRTNEQIAGLLTEDRKSLRSTMEYMSSSIEAKENKFTGNTTLAVIVTNAYFDKAQLCKIAGMAHDGYARSINPVHTSGPRYIFSHNTMNRPLLPI